MIGVTKSENLEKINFFIYDEDAGEFKFEDVRGLYYENCLIKNIIANDITNDSNMDLIVTVYFPAENKTETHINMFDEATGIFKNIYTITESEGNFLMGDFDGDRLYCLILLNFIFSILFFI